MERAAFDRLVVDQLPGLLRFATRLTGCAESAEDLVHDSLVRAIDRCESLREAGKLRPWLFQVVINCFRDRLRAGAAAEPEVERVDARAIDPVAIAAVKELGERVAVAVSNLPARQREVLVLISFEGFDPQQAATILDISHGSVRTNLHLARERLKELLRDDLC